MPILIRAAGLIKNIDAAIARTRDLSPVLGTVVRDIVRDQVAKEFRDAAWYRPDGSKEPWQPAAPFGTKPGEGAGKRTGIDSGDYFRALVGRGPGAVVKVGPRSLSVGVDAGLFPYAKVLRGGTGAHISTAPTIVKPRKKIANPGAAYVTQFAMWWRLGIEFGVWLSEETLRAGLKIYPRPHLTRHPELERRAAKAVAAWIAKGLLR